MVCDMSLTTDIWLKLAMHYHLSYLVDTKQSYSFIPPFRAATFFSYGMNRNEMKYNKQWIHENILNSHVNVSKS